MAYSFELEDVLLCPDEIPARIIRAAKREIRRDNTLLINYMHPSKAYCYLCGQEVKAGPSRNYKFRIGYDTCPNCGKNVFCCVDRSSATWDSMFIANLGTIERGKDGKTVFIRQWHLNRCKDNGWHGPEQLVEVARYAVRGKTVGKWTKEHRGRFFINKYYDPLEIWQLQKRDKLKIYDDWFNMVLPTKCQMQKITKGTSLQYMDIYDYEDYVTEKKTPHNCFAYMASFARKRAFELLWKAGYKDICLSNYGAYSFNGKLSDGVTWSADSITKALSLPRYVLKAKPAKNWDRQSLYNARLLLPYIEAGRISRQIIGEAVFQHDAKTLETVLKKVPHLSADHILKYIKKQDEPIYMYRDYIEECIKLRLDLRDKAVLFPKNLMNAHRRTMQLVNFKKDEILQEQFTAAAQKMEPLNWTSDAFFIRVAVSAQELRAEGETLHHCVGGYASRMANGETVIFFVRKKDRPDVPFYTLEYRDGRVVQCRTKQNKSYDTQPEVAAFVTNWLEYIRKNKLAA